MQHDYDKILTRLTVILSRLYQAEQLKPSDLAKEFNVSERTIQRDFKDRLIHFPIYYENKHWKMQNDFKIEKKFNKKKKTIKRDYKDRLIHFPINYKNKHWKM